MGARQTNTEIAKLLENFLDEHEENLPPSMFRLLDDLAQEIDNAVENLDEEHDAAIEELTDQITELQNELEEIE